MGLLTRWMAAGLLLPAGGCGPQGGSLRPLPGPTGRMNPIYDALAVFPDTAIIAGGLTYRGLEIDLEIEFDDPTVRDEDPFYTAEARVVAFLAGGVAQRFVVPRALRIEGTLSDDVLRTGLFGPIQVGTASLLLELTGALRDGARRASGDAALFGLPDDGGFTAVKRRRYLVAGTDLMTIGQVSVIDVRYDARFGVAGELEVVSSDPVARVEDGRPFVVNRYTFDNVQGLDARRGFRTAFQHSTGNGSNPHDLVVLPASQGGTPDGVPSAAGPGLALVTRYEPPFNDLAFLDLADGALVARVDLAPYARNRDGLPRADQAALVGGLVYVTLQDVDRAFTRFETGRVAVIDPVRRAVVDVIDLSGQNPFEAMVFSEATGLIYVGMAGIFPGLQAQALTGGVEAIDPAGRRSLGLVVDDDDLGGNVSHVAIHSATRGYCVVTDAAFRNFVRAFDPSTGEVLGTIYETHDRIAALLADGDGYLLVADASFSIPRVIVFDAVTGAPVTSLTARVPPFSIAILTRGLDPPARTAPSGREP